MVERTILQQLPSKVDFFKSMPAHGSHANGYRRDSRN
jgi:hypothetical protein